MWEGCGHQVQFLPLGYRRTCCLLPPPRCVPWCAFLLSLSGLCRCGPLICPSVCYSAYWVLPEVWIQWCKDRRAAAAKVGQSLGRHIRERTLDTTLRRTHMGSTCLVLQCTLFVPCIFIGLVLICMCDRLVNGPGGPALGLARARQRTLPLSCSSNLTIF